MTNPALFKFKDHDVRVVEINGEPWFLASDVYGSISLRQHGGVVNPLDVSEKTMRGRTSVGSPPGVMSG
ncbi:hypothetical protein [Sinorhizobium meliloti]|nr:hypothetical protein U8C39_16880 [Sinorhizobium meliloti]WQP34158.1 hypothetical protein U8C45_16840 [Sinorhizobium meliloti]